MDYDQFRIIQHPDKGIKEFEPDPKSKKRIGLAFFLLIYAQGCNRLTSGTYTFRTRNTDEDTTSLANTHFFKKGKFAVDLNRDGELKSANNEFLKITGVIIEIEVESGVYTIAYDLKLENDEVVTGTFSKGFDQV